MKPAPFEYRRPATVDEAAELLAQFGDEAKVLAGGQSLVPMMNLRLARPTALIDIGRVPGLREVAVGDNAVEIGALVRHAELERNDIGGVIGDLLRTVARHIGHLPIRTRGTIGGSLAHADPAAEWCLLAAALDGEVAVKSSRGSRVIPVATFFDGYFTTAMAFDEVLTAVRLPNVGDDCRYGFREFARRAGDFAVVTALTVLHVVDGRVRQARVALGGVADRPIRARTCEAMLVDGEPCDALFAEVSAVAAKDIDPSSDVQATADDRRDLVRAMVRRALQDAMAS